MRSNTAGFEKKPAGFGNRHGGLCDETPQASGQGLGRSSPKAYLPPGAVSCTASMSHPISSTEFVATLKFTPKHLKHLGGRFTESLLATRCACVVSPKAYPSPGAVSCTASMFHPISSTEFVVTPDLSPNSFDVPERSANGASPNPDEPRRSFL
ncbi:hypothetical protein IX307_000316 [Bacteroides pyogenes]|uniref:hypothetical protein n=1 Tax=Bacteroides pyogenes TaxID=310300 RepID=UPI001BA6AB52|nr:hypothetical protein [Bacteroides pyogenes]MBR8719138.1 hypothetical protein [Bacteroides pyogenes]MBR8724066.1 hypothetical protein [Bacteroides pyogenes]MBR8737615.1 hypothetical protein [Bacteroides pyogenes]MBR8753190.1 hypothetical protein [Bacteroides pyogenes]MBR8786015.1 hypothetical protein [Bacteroides pyogenes]